jgi:hypothetical protein
LELYALYHFVVGWFGDKTSYYVKITSEA